MDSSPNLLIAALPADVRKRMEGHFKVIELKEGHVLHRPGQDIEQLHFPIDCLISITVTMEDGHTVEAGIVGSREMVGLNAFMGGKETNQTEYICQFPGRAVRIPAKRFLDEFDTEKGVRDVMLRFTQAYIAQLSQNVACNRTHNVEQRMARWLLECRDRLRTDNIPITHEFIAQMLGVRRASVTDAAAKLSLHKLIEGGRKSFRVVDSAGLEKASCECFRVILAEYARLLGSAIEKGGGTIRLPN